VDYVPIVASRAIKRPVFRIPRAVHAAASGAGQSVGDRRRGLRGLGSFRSLRHRQRLRSVAHRFLFGVRLPDRRRRVPNGGLHHEAAHRHRHVRLAGLHAVHVRGSVHR